MGRYGPESTADLLKIRISKMRNKPESVGQIRVSWKEEMEKIEIKIYDIPMEVVSLSIQV